MCSHCEVYECLQCYLDAHLLLFSISRTEREGERERRPFERNPNGTLVISLVEKSKLRYPLYVCTLASLYERVKPFCWHARYEKFLVNWKFLLININRQGQQYVAVLFFFSSSITRRYDVFKKQSIVEKKPSRHKRASFITEFYCLLSLPLSSLNFATKHRLFFSFFFGRQ